MRIEIGKWYRKESGGYAEDCTHYIYPIKYDNELVHFHLISICETGSKVRLNSTINKSNLLQSTEDMEEGFLREDYTFIIEAIFK